MAFAWIAPQNRWHLRRHGEGKSAGKAFVAMDRTLDKTEIGPRWLLDERVAQCVMDALRYGERQLGLHQLSLGSNEQSRSHFDLSGIQVIEDHQSGQEFFGAAGERNSRAYGPAILAG